MKRLLALALASLMLCSVRAITYEREDSLRVVALLREGAKQPANVNLTLFYAHQLEGTPYVAATLEVNKTEQLVVNLRQLDCTTLVENVAALTLTTRQGSARWQDFCHWLTMLRYRRGRMDGYLSRNHYFSQWVRSGVEQGLLLEPKATPAGNYWPFCGVQQTDLHFMSTHPDAYPMLGRDPQTLEQLRAAEQETAGDSVRYIPSHLLNRSREALKYVQDGDILALVTSRDGLDVSHLGLAQWQDGRLHMLHASSQHGRVLLDPQPLFEYMQKRTSLLGIRVVRVK